MRHMNGVFFTIATLPTGRCMPAFLSSLDSSSLSSLRMSFSQYGRPKSRDSRSTRNSLGTSKSPVSDFRRISRTSSKMALALCSKPFRPRGLTVCCRCCERRRTPMDEAPWSTFRSGELTSDRAIEATGKVQKVQEVRSMLPKLQPPPARTPTEASNDFSFGSAWTRVDSCWLFSHPSGSKRCSFYASQACSCKILAV
uniref:Uncharacterized protein n=1 Tax=Ixodes ricinus TaxID=34613 RepID=A0A6B0V3F1_IXORI